MARAHGAISIVDNSWASPIFQNPIALGCDLSLHSASKYIGGHSDVVAGVVAGSRELIGKLRREVLPYLGGKLSPFDAWLLLRGLADAAGAHARARAERAASSRRDFRAHPAGGRGASSGLSQPLPKGLSGTSGLFSIELDGSIDIPAFCDALRIFKLGVSWGGHESLICPAGVTRVQVGGPNPRYRISACLSAWSASISGWKTPEALWSDLLQALEQAVEREENSMTIRTHFARRRRGAADERLGHRRQTTLSLVEVITSPERTETLKQLVGEFEAANPGVTVEITSLPWNEAFEKFATMVSAGETPDVVEMPDTWQALYAKNGSLGEPRALSREMGAYGRAERQARCTFARYVDNTAYLIPYGFYLRAMFYNKKLFEEAGVAEPPKTLDEFRAAAEKVSASSRANTATACAAGRAG